MPKRLTNKEVFRLAAIAERDRREKDEEELRLLFGKKVFRHQGSRPKRIIHLTIGETDLFLGLLEQPKGLTKSDWKKLRKLRRRLYRDIDVIATENMKKAMSIKLGETPTA